MHKNIIKKNPKKKISEKIKSQLVYLIKNDEQVRREILNLLPEKSDSVSFDKSEYIHINEYNQLKQEIEEYKNLKAENDILKNTISSLNTELANVTKSKTNAEKNVKNYENEKSKLDSEIQKLKKQLDNATGFKKRYSIIDECYQDYLNLSDNKKSELKGIIYADSVQSFFACAGKSNFVRRFSEYITKCIMKIKGTDEDIEILKKIFDTLFNVYNESEGSIKYERDDVRTGDVYNTEKYSTIGLQQGTVTDILFLGYHSTENNREFCKSIVEVSE